ncbi:L-lactate dehydrogenase complex protein LldE [Ectothiorhodosinus mongolicus]|uniref:L-lactate dehydrogenase complex protein LldE n=1 Tax=Ectothiorhodosinus mongolicus TaxID=233100 RepID=A0A1R3W8I0_9GAMM|nr:(Fe-S)-binding protein [Ectothiorhodosinus mongolicus]ULX57686.1 Fe-S oxidoreductase [Ectothiorhodosinus mongolicus]SIT73542.1 L-lactate dehydrogenase complex protein LldE [Ectothiorhodosinus mongolicus]
MPLNTENQRHQDKPIVALFVSCLVDLYRPSIGFSAVELLEAAGCEVRVPSNQTCCGQPAYNSGDNALAAKIARQTIEALADHDYVVVPSGSCAGMLHHYTALFRDDPVWSKRAEDLKAKTFELTDFLLNQRGLKTVSSQFDGVVTYHDSCSGLRELGIKTQPRALLSSVSGLELREMADAEVCCGFGGLFCVKYPPISGRMVDNKVRAALATGADALLGGDLGCLLNMAGRLRHVGANMRVYHVAEVLAGQATGPGIGEV